MDEAEMKCGSVIVAAAAVAAACILPAAPAAAQSMPRYDVAAHCRKIASVGGSYSASIEKGCFGMEQGAYDLLKPMWRQLPASMREHCDRIARVGGGGSYSILKGCVAMESDAASQPNTFKY